MAVNGFVLEGGGSNYATFSKGAKIYRVDLIKSKKGQNLYGKYCTLQNRCEKAKGHLRLHLQKCRERS